MSAPDKHGALYDFIAEMDGTLTTLESAVAAMQLAALAEDDVPHADGGRRWLAHRVAAELKHAREQWNRAFQAAVEMKRFRD